MYLNFDFFLNHELTLFLNVVDDGITGKRCDYNSQLRCGSCYVIANVNLHFLVVIIWEMCRMHVDSIRIELFSNELLHFLLMVY